MGKATVVCVRDQGRYTILNKETGVSKCTSIPHLFADLVRFKYVDDTVVSANTQDLAVSISQYADQLLGKFSYKFKGWNHAMEPYDPECPTLHTDGEFL